MKTLTLILSILSIIFMILGHLVFRKVKIDFNLAERRKEKAE